jgi:uncharacterized membrane protein YeaQ/YmgE (transglycosylase-associated protein family)
LAGTAVPAIRRPRKGAGAMYNIIGNVVGAALAILFAGFLAFKIDKLPLILIVVAVLALMIYSFFDDIRNDQKIMQRRKQKDATR